MLDAGGVAWVSSGKCRRRIVFINIDNLERFFNVGDVVMNGAQPNTLLFKRSRFAAQLPLSYRYTRSHFWVEQREGIRLRLGLTSFGTRMIGEMVDHKFETELGGVVHPGQVLGWIEGFKAVVDVLCAGRGSFAGGNPVLDENILLVNQSPFSEGWLYEIDGQLAGEVLDVNAYAEHLKLTIDRLQQENET